MTPAFRCPICGYPDPAFGSLNGTIKCGACGEMYHGVEAMDYQPPASPSPNPPNAAPAVKRGRKSGDWLKDGTRRRVRSNRPDRTRDDDPLSR
jgi:uncharacterized Zn finger protein (UPF0148 family)